MNCVQDMKHCCWYVVVFSHAFEFSLFKREPASKIDVAGSACRGGSLHRALKSCVLRVPFWYSGLELQLGPLSPIRLKRHWGKQGFLLRCPWLPFTGWEPSPGLLFFCTSCSYCRCKVVDVCSPGAWAGGWAGLNAKACNQKAGEGTKSRPGLIGPWRCL